MGDEMARMSRSAVVNRVFVADRWLQQRFNTSIAEAQADQIVIYLDSVPEPQRGATLDALIAYGDDMVRKGRAPRNVARTIVLP